MITKGQQCSNSYQSDARVKEHPLGADCCKGVMQHFWMATDLGGVRERGRCPMRFLRPLPLLLLKPCRSLAGSQSDRCPGHRSVYKGRMLPSKEHQVNYSYSFTNHLTIRAHPPTPSHTQHDAQANASRNKQTLVFKVPEGEISIWGTALLQSYRDTSESDKRGPSHLFNIPDSPKSACECVHSKRPQLCPFILAQLVALVSWAPEFP